MRFVRIGLACSLLLGALGCTSAPHRGADPPPRLIVSLTFNDGLASQYEYARPLLDRYGMRATFYLSSGWLDGGWACCMRWWEVDGLYRAGHEIGGMGLQHEDLTGVRARDPWPVTRTRLRREVCDDRRRLADRGYDPVSFAYPRGAFVAAFPDGTTPQDLLRACGYRAGRAVGGLGSATSRYANRLPPPDPYAVRTPDSTGSRPLRLPDLQQQVRTAARVGGWLPVAFNHVCHRGAPTYRNCITSSRPVEDTTLAAFLDWLAAAGRPGGAPAGTAVRTVRAAVGARPQPPLPPRPTVVSLTFDDASRDQYLMRGALRDHEMHATFYINSSFVDRADGFTMTWDQIRGLAADGNDMGGHSLNHRYLPGLRPAELQRQVCADRRRLVAEGLSPVSFAYPYGAYDPAAQRMLRACGYRWARTAGSVSPSGPLYAGTIPPKAPYATSALGLRDNGPMRLDYLQSAVESAAAHGGGWVQIIFHRLCRASQRDYSPCMRSLRAVDVEELSQFLDWLEASAPAGTQVRSVQEVMEER
jgi:peptidoglycan/xylan/chitin deacetylase (PgdA/CDA1 family)